MRKNFVFVTFLYQKKSVENAVKGEVNSFLNQKSKVLLEALEATSDTLQVNFGGLHSIRFIYSIVRYFFQILKAIDTCKFLHRVTYKWLL